MSLALSVRNLSKSYTIHHQQRESTLAETLLLRMKSGFRSTTRETFWALKDLSFDVQKGEVLGIIGRNGAGKSTLLKILSRITEPTTGQIDLYGRVGSLLEVGTGFHPELTGRENIFLNGAILGMTRHEIKKQFDAIVDFAGVEKFLDTPVKRYSSGMYVRLAFAVAAHLRSEILIVDEVLAVGDAEFQKKCLGKMQDVAHDGRTVLFVSHNMGAVRELCTVACFLVAGELRGLSSTDDAVRSYLDQRSSNEFEPASGPLKRVHVEQVANTLVVRADWDYSYGLRLPCLGFVISDSLGNPIVGANPVIAGVVPRSTDSYSGRVICTLTEPRLLDGQYQLSVWFGDGALNFVEYHKCVVFEVQGMAGPRQHSAPLIVGAVAPRCHYEFASIGQD